ncbi:MAG: hypothetical protein WCP93_03630 [Candidatus Berkelbacteria bacterium]
MNTVDESILIDQDVVNQVFLDCLCTPREFEQMDKDHENCLIVESRFGRYLFNIGRLEAQREQIKTWLEALPRVFFEENGAPFSVAFYQENGPVWAGIPMRIDQLFAMGQGLDLVVLLPESNPQPNQNQAWYKIIH